MNEDKNIEFLVVDLFCGAGGVSEGFLKSGVAEVIICVNHDAKAIEAHKLNHTKAVHFVEDVRKVDIVKFLPIIEYWKTIYPNAKLLLWASVECTNHSIAKGGLPKDADSRTLPVHLYPYVKILNPDYIGIENVKEFRDWSPLVPKIKMLGMTAKNQKAIYRAFDCVTNSTTHFEGAHSPLFLCSKTNALKPWLIPDPNRKGELFRRFIEVIKGIGNGYHYKDADLNAKFYGAYTNRLRFFGIFAKFGLGIHFPTPTHGKGLLPLKPVREVLELENIGKSIFHGRKKPHCDKTLTRILAGLKKFSSRPSYLMTCTSPGFLKPIEEPSSTLTTACHKALITVNKGQFLDKYFGNSKAVSINEPSCTLTTKDRCTLVTPEFIHSAFGNPVNNPRVSSIDASAPSVTTQGRQSVVFTLRHYGSLKKDKGVTNVTEPNPTITASGSFSLAHCQYVHSHYSRGTEGVGIDGPYNTLTTKAKHSLVTGAYLMNPQYSLQGSSLEAPCPTVIARQDKAPIHMVISSFNDDEIPHYLLDTDSDTEVMKSLKKYCRENGISDIFLRMLLIDELKRIQGFRTSYKLVGNQATQKKHIGNSVEVNMAMVLILCLAAGIYVPNTKTVVKQAQLEFA